jgi:adenine-specific DNA methylase
MSNDIRESDWKIFREIHPVALARFCDRILAEVLRLAQDSSTNSHERYLLVFQLIGQRDADIAAAFNDFRRSTAIRQLAVMQSRDMLTEEEFARFSPEVQETVKFLSEIHRPRKGAGRKRN